MLNLTCGKHGLGHPALWWPFWLKAGDCFAPHGGMSWGVASLTEGDLILISGGLITFLSGLILGCCCCRPKTLAPKAKAASTDSWRRLTEKALRFIGRRRRISQAFTNYKDHQLRPATKAGARQRKRAHTPGGLLHEGFAIQHGSYGSRDGGHNHTG